MENSKNKIGIKEENASSADLILQKGREFSTSVATMKTSNDNVFLDEDFDAAFKSDVSSEALFPEFCLVTERECCTKQIKSEMFTSSGSYKIDVKTENEEQTLVSNFGSQGEREFLPEDSVMNKETYSSDPELDKKIEVKEEPWCLETEISSVCEEVKGGNSTPVKSTRLTSEKASQGGSGLCSSLSQSDLGHCQMGEAVSDFEGARMSVDTISYKCNICEKSIKWKSHFKRHLLLHSDIKPYKCDRCKKSFKWKSILDQHVRLHLDIRSYKCDKCEKSFKQKPSLDQHVRLHADIRPYTCDICEMGFKLKSHLDHHVKTHADIRPYKCDICEKSFKQRCGLNQHVLSHSDSRPYICERCEMGFKLKSRLDLHVKTHADIRPYKCDICEKSFKQKCGLNQHVVSHSDARPYKCERCEKCFKQKSSLNNHVLLHSDTRPYKCDRCEKSFKQKSKLNRHVLVH